MKTNISIDNSLDFLKLGINKENYFLYVNQIYMRYIRENLYKSIYFFLSYDLKLTYPFLTRKNLQDIDRFGIKTNINLSIIFQKLILVFSFLKAFLLVFCLLRKITLRKTVQANNPFKNIYIKELHNLFIYKNQLIFDKKIFKDYSINIEKIFYKRKLENTEVIDFIPKILIFDYLKFFFKSFKILMNYKKLNLFLKFNISEIIETNFLVYSQKNSSFNNLLFSESYRINRPLWSYFLEEVGWNIIYYNYSSNQSDDIKFYPKNYIPGEFKYFSFNKCIFSNDELFQYHMNKSKFFLHEMSKVDTNLFFFKNYFHKYFFKKKIISIFDTTIYEDHICKSIPRPYFYFTKENVSKFYEDILDCLKFFDELVILIKIKNKINLKVISSILRSKNHSKNKIYIIQNINTFKLIVKSDLVISIPFSTPSLIADINNIKSIIHDPLDMIKKPPCKRNIHYSGSKNTLFNFVKNAMKN